MKKKACSQHQHPYSKETAVYLQWCMRWCSAQLVLKCATPTRTMTKAAMTIWFGARPSQVNSCRVLQATQFDMLVYIAIAHCNPSRVQQLFLYLPMMLETCWRPLT
jgi:hypothetical protein